MSNKYILADESIQLLIQCCDIRKILISLIDSYLKNDSQDSSLKQLNQYYKEIGEFHLDDFGESSKQIMITKLCNECLRLIQELEGDK
jgi:hypothetical protein